MKKISTIIITLLILTNYVAAQSFSVIPRSGKSQGSSVKNAIEVNVSFTNTSSDVADSFFAYEVIDVNIPSAWALQICDPFACLEGSGKVGFKNDFIMKNTIGENAGIFRIDFSPNATSGIGTAKILVKSIKTGYSDTISAEAKVWAVSVKENAVKQNKEFSFYPNPAKDELVLKYNSKENFQVEIFNILGSKVKTFSLYGGQTTVNIQDLESGIYFLRFKDDGKTISKTFTKN